MIRITRRARLFQSAVIAAFIGVPLAHGQTRFFAGHTGNFNATGYDGVLRDEPATYNYFESEFNGYTDTRAGASRGAWRVYSLSSVFQEGFGNSRTDGGAVAGFDTFVTFNGIGSTAIARQKLLLSGSLFRDASIGYRAASNIQIDYTLGSTTVTGWYRIGINVGFNELSSGILSGLTGAQFDDYELILPPITVPTNTRLPMKLRFWATTTAYSPFNCFKCDPPGQSISVSAFENTLTFPVASAVFQLPQGVSAYARGVNIVNNSWRGESACAPDYDGDGFITGLDFDLFVTAFEAGDISADFDDDGFITGLDFDLYVQAFETGC